MAIVNGYATLTEVKSRLDITDSTSDTELEQVIEAVSRGIDQWISHRRGVTQFYAIASSARYFTAYEGGRVVVDDFHAIASLKTDDDGDGVYENTWATTDYWRWPYNAAAKTQPWEMIEVSYNGDEIFPLIPRAVEVTATWGYSATTPDVINEACIIASIRLWKRRDAPFGVAGAPALGQMVAITPLLKDADIADLMLGIPARTI